MPPRFVPLPPAFFDRRVSDAQLQEQWAAGTEEAVRRLRATVARLKEELAQAEDALERAEAFAADTEVVRDRYRRHAATVRPVEPPQRMLPRANG